DRQRDNRRLCVVAGPSFRQRDVGGLKGNRVGGHVGREGPVHETLDLGNTAEIRRELQHAAAASIEMVAHSPVGTDVRTAEPVDRLLRVADDEQLARLRSIYRSEEHTSELQSRRDLVCRLLLEKKKNKIKIKKK